MEIKASEELSEGSALENISSPPSRTRLSDWSHEEKMLVPIGLIPTNRHKPVYPLA